MKPSMLTKAHVNHGYKESTFWLTEFLNGHSVLIIVFRGIAKRYECDEHDMRQRQIFEHTVGLLWV